MQSNQPKRPLRLLTARFEREKKTELLSMSADLGLEAAMSHELLHLLSTTALRHSRTGSSCSAQQAILRLPCKLLLCELTACMPTNTGFLNTRLAILTFMCQNPALACLSENTHRSVP